MLSVDECKTLLESIEPKKCIQISFFVSTDEEADALMKQLKTIEYMSFVQKTASGQCVTVSSKYSKKNGVN